jgi:hypothetical protein
VHGLVAAVLCNGMTDNARHQARFHAIYAALYLDLGLAEPGAAGREKEVATYA